MIVAGAAVPSTLMTTSSRLTNVAEVRVGGMKVVEYIHREGEREQGTGRGIGGIRHRPVADARVARQVAPALHRRSPVTRGEDIADIAS